jgi:hypothetical protein
MKKLIACAALAAATAFTFATPSVDAAPKCPGDGDYIYYGNNAQECAVIRFVCDEGYEYFSNKCGCGCRPV